MGKHICLSVTGKIDLVLVTSTGATSIREVRERLLLMFLSRRFYGGNVQQGEMHPIENGIQEMDYNILLYVFLH